MVFALGAGKLFKLDNGGEFEETIIGKSPDSPNRVNSISDQLLPLLQQNVLTPSSLSLPPNGRPRVINPLT